MQVADPMHSSPEVDIVISTDGSAWANGKEDASAGVGVFFGPGDRRNASLPLGPGKQTNQRAELMAIKVALDRAPPTSKVLIRTDSKYAITCVELWPKWMRQSWRKPAGIRRQNEEIIQPIIDKIDIRRIYGARTDFLWVKGHAGDEGNEAADALANIGAKRAFFANRRKKKLCRDQARAREGTKTRATNPATNVPPAPAIPTAQSSEPKAKKVAWANV